MSPLTQVLVTCLLLVGVAVAVGLVLLAPALLASVLGRRQARDVVPDDRPADPDEPAMVNLTTQRLAVAGRGEREQPLPAPPAVLPATTPERTTTWLVEHRGRRVELGSPVRIGSVELGLDHGAAVVRAVEEGASLRRGAATRPLMPGRAAALRPGDLIDGTAGAISVLSADAPGAGSVTNR